MNLALFSVYISINEVEGLLIRSQNKQSAKSPSSGDFPPVSNKENMG